MNKEELKKRIKERIDEVADENGKISFDNFLNFGKEFLDVDPQKIDIFLDEVKNLSDDTCDIAQTPVVEEVNPDDLPF